MGLGEQKTSRKTKKNKKTNFAWTYPRFFSQNCFFWFFLVFFEFLDKWAWESKKPREKQKKQKKPILHGLTQDSSHRIVFFGFLRVFGQVGLGEQKTSRKTKKTKKTILHGLTQDSSHRIVFFVFFWFSSSFWTSGLGRAGNKKKGKKTKRAKTQRSQRGFLIFFPLFCELLKSVFC